MVAVRTTFHCGEINNGTRPKTIRRPRTKTNKVNQRTSCRNRETVHRYLKQAEKASDPKLRKRYFNTALNLVKRSEQLIDRMETEMAALKHPWRATTASKTRAKKK